MTETNADRNRFTLMPRSSGLSEDHPFTAHDVCRMTGLSPSEVSETTRSKHGQEPLLHPLKITISHTRTNTFTLEDLKVFERIRQLTKTEGLKIGQAINSLRSSLIPGG